jgi:hypothetical protein
VFLLLVVCGPSIGAAGDQVGTRSFPFLRIGTDARAVGLGEAYAAIADGAEAVGWNVAGIALLNHPTLSTSYLKYLTDMHAGSVAFVQPAGRALTWGLSLRFFRVGNIPRTTVENPTGGGLAPFSSTDLSFQVALAYRLTTNAAVGATGAVVSGTIDDAGALGYSTDLGLLWRDAFWGLRLGAAARHIGAVATAYEAEADPFPTEVAFGAARSFLTRTLLVSSDLVWSVDRGADLHLGSEYEIVTDFFFRGGYRTETSELRKAGSSGNLTGLTFGFGFRRLRSYRVDYAYASMGELGGTHRFSLSWVLR